MSLNYTTHIHFHDLHPPLGNILNDVLDGLNQPQKTLPSKYFYDDKGSLLFEEICTLDEYYPTRTELSIMRDNTAEITQHIGEHASLLELGSGASLKTRVILNELADSLAGYIPIEISMDALRRSVDILHKLYPSLPIAAICADYTQPITIPQAGPITPKRRVVYFPGSTIGNMTQEHARTFLQTIASWLSPGDGLLIGVDLHKDPSIIRAAYNDTRGITAAFNLNILARLNREIGSNFNLDAFTHEAVYNLDQQRIEMYLTCTQAHDVTIGHTTLPFEKGTTILTEYSHKYTPEGFQEIAHTANFHRQSLWVDEHNLFSVQFFELKD